MLLSIVFGRNYCNCYNITVPIASKIDSENSWMYSKSIQNHLLHSTSKISLPVRHNIAACLCCATHKGSLSNELQIQRSSRAWFFQQSLPSQDKSRICFSSKCSPYSTSLSSANTTYNLTKSRVNDVMEKEDDEDIENENHSAPLIKNE